MDIVKATQAAKLMAIGMYTELQTREPEFIKIVSKSKRPHDDWDFFYAVAVVGLLLLTLNPNEKELAKYLNNIKERDAEFAAALDNFAMYMNNYPPTKDDATFRYLLGQFVLWNIANEEPKHEQAGKLCNMIGFLVLQSARNLTNF